MATLLDQLKTHTVVVADTGDIHSIQKWKPRDATTNPSLITAAAQMPEYAALIDGAIEFVKQHAPAGATRADLVKASIDRLAVEYGLRILEIVPGRVSTEVDARLSFDIQGTIDKAHALIAQYEKAGAKRERVLIKIASTWEGIRAAERLEQEGIHCNLTLLFGVHQAVACAEAKVTLISPFVGRILDWYLKDTGRATYPPHEDPGVLSVTAIYNYYKKHGYKTEVMGASFRNAGEILELCGCDLLTIAPKLLAELGAAEGILERRISPEAAAGMKIEKLKMDEATFRQMHSRDKMASEKLQEGIEGFTRALVALERLIEARMDGQASDAARTLFGIFDLDGDGYITREEWAGLASVFEALDRDGDGKITPEELGAGLGAAFTLR